MFLSEYFYFERKVQVLHFKLRRSSSRSQNVKSETLQHDMSKQEEDVDFLSCVFIECVQAISVLCLSSLTKNLYVNISNIKKMKMMDLSRSQELSQCLLTHEA